MRGAGRLSSNRPPASRTARPSRNQGLEPASRPQMPIAPGRILAHPERPRTQPAGQENENQPACQAPLRRWPGPLVGPVPHHRPRRGLIRTPQPDTAAGNAHRGERDQRVRVPGPEPDHDRADDRGHGQAQYQRQARLDHTQPGVHPAHHGRPGRNAGQQQRSGQRRGVPGRGDDEHGRQNAGHDPGPGGQHGAPLRRGRRRRGPADPGRYLGAAHRSRLAGTPAYTAPGSQSLVTTDPAATTVPGPMLTPGRIVARAPIQQRSPMRTSR